MPFADLASDVAGRLQPLGDGEFRQRQRSLAVVLHAESLLVAPGDHAGARGHALRRADIAARETHAIARELVEMRRADVAVHTLRAEVGPSVVVAVDEDDVGLRRMERRDWSKEQESSEELHGGLKQAADMASIPFFAWANSVLASWRSSQARSQRNLRSSSRIGWSLMLA